MPAKTKFKELKNAKFSNQRIETKEIKLSKIKSKLLPVRWVRRPVASVVDADHRESPVTKRGSRRKKWRCGGRCAMVREQWRPKVDNGGAGDGVWASTAAGDRRGGKSESGRSPVEKLQREGGGLRWEKVKTKRGVGHGLSIPRMKKRKFCFSFFNIKKEGFNVNHKINF